jgi:hypothetical protein
MTNAAQKWLSAFDALPRKAQKPRLSACLRGQEAVETYHVNEHTVFVMEVLTPAPQTMT